MARTSPSAKASRHLRESSVETLWKRLSRGERDFARRLAQLAHADAALASRGKSPPKRTHIYTALITGTLPRFAAYTECRQRRSQGLVEKAITHLRARGHKCVLRSDIAVASRLLDPEGKGVSLSVLYQNAACASLVATANGRFPQACEPIPAAARRLGRQRLVAQVITVEAALAAITADLMQSNEQLLELEGYELGKAIAGAQAHKHQS